jgi:membrane protease YdiL (CAAX protease family)
MEIAVGLPSWSDRSRQIASRMHTILVVAILAAWTLLGSMEAEQMRRALNPDRLRFYLLTLSFEWLLAGFVLVGVRRFGAQVGDVLGQRWGSPLQVLKDIGIAAAFWLVSSGLLVLLARLLKTGQQATARRVEFLLPHGGLEIALWVALSITAGICEEAIFRGYLQRQFISLTRNVPAGVLLSAMAFGAAHAYQGFRMVILIALYGAMFGVLAQWRGSVRPGMMAHAWQDSLSGVVGAVTRH